MDLNREIKQQSFKSSHQKAAVNILFTGNWLELKVKKHLKPYKLTPQQYNVLRILRGSNPQPLSVMQIRERMLDKMSDSSRIVERLIMKKLVAKKPCRRDKRLVDIFITTQGLKLLTDIDQQEEHLGNFLDNLSLAEAETLNVLLDKLRA
jgi:DNA-binding MarR family transcriptional regulator